MPDDIARWLESIGLGEYAAAFLENAVEVRDLPHLTDGDLGSLGLPLGPRRRVQAAIKALSETPTSLERQSAAGRHRRQSPKRRSHNVLTLNGVRSPSCSLTLWVPRTSRDSLIRKT